MSLLSHQTSNILKSASIPSFPPFYSLLFSFFLVHTPSADYCLPGITRHTVMHELIPLVLGKPVVERRISLAEFHAADEVFTTGP